jgi:very-short-patch-repair endonuclease
VDTGFRPLAPGTLEAMDLNATRPFPRWKGLRAGITRTRLDGPGFQRPFHGVLISSGVVLTPRLRVEAALVPFFPSAYATHASAARVHQVPIPPIPDEHVTVIDEAHRLRRRGIHVHVSTSTRVVVVDGVRVSSLPNCFVELAELIPLVDLVVAGDWMVKNRPVTIDQLRKAASGAPGAAGQLARRAAALVREEVDSPMESRLRMLIVLAGLPEPDVNIKIRDEIGSILRRYDLGWRVIRLALEYDGKHHAESAEQWEHDIGRRDDMAQDDWRLITVTAKGIYTDPHGTLKRIHRALLKAGLPGVPARLSNDWRAHFPGHVRAG